MVGDHLLSTYSNSFPCDSILYVNRGTTSLFALWKAGYIKVRDKETKKILTPLGESIVTASSVKAYPLYAEGPANITKLTLTLNGTTVESDSIYLKGLIPNTAYTATYAITVDDQYEYTGSVNFQTKELNFVNEQPKVITEGNVVIASQSQLDDEETNVGFEWRRTDWSEDFQSNSCKAYLYEGMMEGYLRNMNTNYLFKYRPYYEAADGTFFYGEWMGIDPTNTSYFEPTVHTYAQQKVEGNTAQLKGYAQRGTDNVASQGFLYWKSSSGNVKADLHLVSSNATKVEVSGTLMETTLSGLDYDTQYTYVAYVTTSEGETFTGEEQTFTTGADPTGVEMLMDEEQHTPSVTGVYDMSGRKLADQWTPALAKKKGIYIVNGRKLMVR